MIIIALISLVAGVLCGQFVFDTNTINIFSNVSDYALYILMFAVGISVGTNKQVFRKLKEYHIKIVIIPFGIIVGSIVGGFICSILLKNH